LCSTENLLAKSGRPATGSSAKVFMLLGVRGLVRKYGRPARLRQKHRNASSADDPQDRKALSRDASNPRAERRRQVAPTADSDTTL